jgi:hypothetical protein
MNKTFMTLALLLLIGGTPALAQSGSGASSSSGASKATPLSAPVGHRQPRVGDVPNEKSNPNDPLSKEDAVLDRKIKSICRGC